LGLPVELCCDDWASFERWIVADEEREMSRLMRESLDELKAAIAGGWVYCGSSGRSGVLADLVSLA